MNKFYKEETTATNEKEPIGVEKMVTTDVNVRVAPGGNVIGARHYGDKVTVVREDGNWSELEEGGFILSSLLK